MLKLEKYWFIRSLCSLILWILTLFMIGLLGEANGWEEGEEGGKICTALKSVTHILQWRNLTQ